MSVTANNGLGRYMGMLKGEPVDFVPRVPILMQFAAEYISENYRTFASDYRVLVKANFACARDFGMDQVSAISDPVRETHGFGGEVVFPENGPPYCPHPPLETTRNISTLSRPDPLHDERMLDRVEAIRAYKKQAGGEYSIMGWIEGPAAEAADLRGPMNFMTDLVDDESYIEELMDLCTDVCIEFALAQIDAGADTIGIGDAIASQVSPDHYERLILPREKKMVEAVHKTGAYSRLHICGDITHLLTGIAGLDIDIIDVDHPVDVSTVREKLGSGIVIAGNLDPVGAVMSGEPDSIRESINGIYRKVGDPYMVAAGCEIPSGTPYENLLALCEPIHCS